ncbi:MAG TPA: putative lipid II flippase FtsW [Clostridiaceae bacterium]|nr:putative lipid II flippase FtsW [Clostridiaceae bacterium]
MRKREYDFWILFTVLVMLAMGTVMVFSASSYSAQHYQNNKYHFLIRQLLWGTIGVISMLIFSKIDYHRIAACSPVLMLISTVMLALVLIPGIGTVINDSRRWFDLKITTFQPSEFTKIAMILFLSFSLSKNSHRLNYFFRGLIPYLLVIGATDALLYFEPHMSAIILITLVSVIILFCAGAKIRHFLVLAVPVSAVGWKLIMSQPYRVNRIMAFLDPFKYSQDEGFQVVNSLYAIASGSVFGRGLGRSLQKNLYLPEPHNDFIFSILAEELGFVGAVTVILLFMLFIWRGVKVAMNAPDMLGSLIAMGITSLIALEAIINIAVVTSTIPTTGMPLPFFSAGGTSTVFLLTSVGILLNISKGTSPASFSVIRNDRNNYGNKRSVSSQKVGEL